MNIFIMSRPSPGPARPAHTRPRPSVRPVGRARLGPKAWPAQALVPCSPKACALSRDTASVVELQQCDVNQQMTDCQSEHRVITLFTGEIRSDNLSTATSATGCRCQSTLSRLTATRETIFCCQPPLSCAGKAPL